MKAHGEVCLLGIELLQFGANDSDVLDCHGHYSNIAIDAKCRPLRPGRQEARRARWLLGLDRNEPRCCVANRSPFRRWHLAQKSPETIERGWLILR
jgi:hypothetical protein